MLIHKALCNLVHPPIHLFAFTATDCITATLPTVNRQQTDTCSFYAAKHSQKTSEINTFVWPYSSHAA